MSLLLNHPSKLCFRRPVLIRSSPRISEVFSSPFMQTPPSSILKAVPYGSSPLVSTSLQQTPPCSVSSADRCGPIVNNEERLTIRYDTPDCTSLDKIVPWEFVYNDSGDSVTIGPSHGWVGTFNEDGILRLQDDLSPCASHTDPKSILLPPLVTLPHCQTQIVTNVAMSTSSPEDEDCVVAVKFLGPQISFCRPAQRNLEWTNIRLESPCFFSSRVMFSKKDEMFRMPGSGGHLIASWDLRGNNTKLHSFRLRNLPKHSKKKRELMDSSYKSEHLAVESSTGETFLLKRYKKTTEIRKGTQTELYWMVFNLNLV